MTLDHDFTRRLGQWLQTDPAERDYEAGALMLLKLSGNRIMYRNMIAAPARFADHIEYQLQKYYNFRVKELTHAEVAQMQQEADRIISERLSLAEAKDKDAPAQLGKRPDHDSLPEEIKVKFEENSGLYKRMRYLHMKLKDKSLDESPCPDSERYPLLKELIEIDVRMRSNWEAYDTAISVKKKTARKKASK